jgi:translation initiation factor 5
MNNPFSKTLNIGGGDDPHYRYKMPSISTKTESKNGGTTIIENIDTIANKLKRSPNEFQKYFSKSLSCNVKYNKDKGIMISAKKEKEELQSILTEYINKFVLCPQCQNPETTKAVGKKKTTLTCAACGKTSNI